MLNFWKGGEADTYYDTCFRTYVYDTLTRGVMYAGTISFQSDFQWELKVVAAAMVEGLSNCSSIILALKLCINK